MIPTKITNVADLAERGRTGDRFELCIPKEHWDLFPEHKETFQLEVDGAWYTATIGKRDAVDHLYVWANCTADDGTVIKITEILRRAGLGVGDTPNLEQLDGHRFRLHTT